MQRALILWCYLFFMVPNIVDFLSWFQMADYTFHEFKHACKGFFKALVESPAKWDGIMACVVSYKNSMAQLFHGLYPSK